MDTTYLYIKEHLETGLKYFGKTKQNPFEYNGSGVYWNRHINQHGNNVKTIIYGIYTDEKEIKKDAIEFSRNNNIVNAKEWANIKEEQGIDGGFDHINNNYQIKEKARLSLIDNITKLTPIERSEKYGKHGKENPWYGHSRSGEKNPMFGKKHDEETKDKISKSNKNKKVVKDIESEIVIGLVDKNHEKILSGEWVSVNKGKKRTEEFKEQRSQEWKEKGIKPPSPKGKKWWNNGKEHIRSQEWPGEGWVRGRIMTEKHKNDLKNSKK